MRQWKPFATRQMTTKPVMVQCFCWVNYTVLVIYLCFQIYFLIDHHCKTQSELTDVLKNSPNLLNFLQSALVTWFLLARQYQTKYTNSNCKKLNCQLFLWIKILIFCSLSQNRSISGEQTNEVLYDRIHISIDQRDELGEQHMTRFT